MLLKLSIWNIGHWFNSCLFHLCCFSVFWGHRKFKWILFWSFHHDSLDSADFLKPNLKLASCTFSHTSLCVVSRGDLPLFQTPFSSCHAIPPFRISKLLPLNYIYCLLHAVSYLFFSLYYWNPVFICSCVLEVFGSSKLNKSIHLNLPIAFCFYFFSVFVPGFILLMSVHVTLLFTCALLEGEDHVFIQCHFMLLAPFCTLTSW